MKILIYGLNFFPELTGVGKYTGEMAFFLAERGHHVRVISAPPYYPQWAVGSGYRAWRYKTEVIRGVIVHRVPIWIPKKISGLTRILHLCSFAASSVFVLFRHVFWRPDVIWTVEPSLVSSPFAIIFSRFAKCRSWLHIQDFEVDAAFDLGIVQSDKIRNAVFLIERFLLRKFDVVSSISKKMVKLSIDKGVSESASVFFPNWVDCTDIFPLLDKNEFRSMLGISDEMVVALYSGNMGEKQGLEILTKAADILKDRSDIHFVFCGNGPGRLVLEANSVGLRNISFLDLQPFEKLNTLLNLADIHLLPQRADAADLVMPSKLTGMAASGRPIVATAAQCTELAETVSVFGRVVQPGDPIALAHAIGDLVDSKAERFRLGALAREYAVSKLDRMSVLKKFEQKLLDSSGT